MARKPFASTVAANVLAHGTGALNIDGCRVEGTPAPTRFDPAKHGHEGWRMNATGAECAANASPLGRWPANLILSDDPDVVAAFPQAKGQQGALTGSEPSSKTANTFGEFAGRVPSEPRGDTGSAARFFYCAKASKKDREEGLEGAPDRVLAMSNQAKAELARGNMHAGDSGMNSAKVRKNHHPTVKPTDLMAYLCRLVTPPGGVVLDPFMGSGSTGKAAIPEGFHFIGVECEPAYFDIAVRRIDQAHAQGQLFEPTQADPVQLDLAVPSTEKEAA
jgi:site-specific DNA-methyltransferase (adenine-specific)